VVDNGNQELPSYPNLEIIKNEKNIGVGASWNMLCEKIFEKSDYALILNDDIYLGKSTHYINNIINKYPSHFLTPTPDWCAFIIPKKIWESVGKFDECFFPAYFEDNSYAYRMKIMRKIHIKTPLLNPFVYKSSQTLEKDVSIMDYRLKNKELYIKMWGGEPMKEKFTTPYGR
jgi:GT2 family glycosyltransferase